MITNFEEGNSISMQVFLDDSQRYDVQRALGVGEKLRFVFTATELVSELTSGQASRLRWRGKDILASGSGESYLVK